MDKLGVVLDDEKTKTAGEGKNCPSCGAPLPRPAFCNNCGTKPFEKQPAEVKGRFSDDCTFDDEEK